MNKNIKMFYAGVLLVSPFLAQGVSATENNLPLEESSKNAVTDEDDPPLLIPKKGLDWSVRPKLLAGVMYFKHITLDPVNLSNKPVPFIGIALNFNINNWFVNGYALDTAKTTDHVFGKNAANQLSESNYGFQRQDYAITIGREITDWLTDSKRWGISVFAGYRQGKTDIQSTGINFNGNPAPDQITLGKGEYTVKGPMGGVGLRIKPFEKSNSQLGLTVGYGPLRGKYTRAFTLPLANQTYPDTPVSNTVNTWVTALNWEGELTPNLSYSLVVDYYAYSMPIQQKTVGSIPEIKEAVSSLKLFLNYRF